jgi:hypothetical protein
MDPDGFAFGKKLEGGLPTDVTVLAAQVNVVFENGTRADISNGVYLHHVISSITGKTQDMWLPFCPGSGSGAFDISKLLPGGLDISKIIPGLDLTKIDLSKLNPGRLGGAGFVGGAVDEFIDYYTTPDGKFNSGYYIPPKISAMMSGEIINYLKEPQEVYIQFDVEFVPGKVGTEAVKTAISVEGCDGFPGTAFKNGVRGRVISKEYEIKKDGTIISFRKS